MEKVCKVCAVSKGVEEYYPRDRTCKKCFNSQRSNTYKKSVCKHCHIEFRPGVRGKYKFCSIKCRFLDKVQIGKGDSCWLWKGHLKARNYGGFSMKGQRSVLAHRVSFKIFNGSVAEDELVLHSCDNPPCVNPKHLFKGTLKDNSQDMLKKGRQSKFSLPGEKHPSAILRNEDVYEIRKLKDSGLTQKQIGERFGVNEETIGNIFRGLTWTHI